MSNNLLLANLNQPDALEAAYHQSPQKFEAQLKDALEVTPDSETLKVWHARLSYCPAAVVKNFSISLLIAFCFITSILAKLPTFLPIEGDWYYPRYIPILIITAVIAYFVSTTKPSRRILKMIVGGVIASAGYLALLPDTHHSASVIMALVHLPMFSLSLLALSFMGDDCKNVESRLNFIRYLGEMLIYAMLILLGGMVLTGVTLGLFSMIGLNIAEWYTQYVVVFGLVCAPLVATYLFDAIQNRESKFASILSNVFAPLFLITVLVYLIATLYQGKSPFTNRDFLITFNGLLVVILALTIFSISGKKRIAEATLSDYINVSLISATLLVNAVALSAILFRLSEYGLTVNRVVVSGANILIFFHLSLLLKAYIKHIRFNDNLSQLETTIAKYLPLYTLWSFIVAVIFPLVFWFK
ncbi:hypothetical protein [Algibacillus agarilyticus]|uniref:hypothetical protein n=1 Tax=Algibacillus agarilyticus TaxID=2234133 RepID=UPI000DD02346|nr:hypothetical protein [Algibacillus agarilyticus]